MALWEAAEKKVNLKLSITQKQGKLHYSASLWNFGKCNQIPTAGPVQVSTSWQDLTELKKLSLFLNDQGDEAAALQGMEAVISGMKSWRGNLSDL